MRILLTVTWPLFVGLLLWLGGYDFDRRGPDIAIITAWAVFMSFWFYFSPWWTDKKERTKE